MTDDIALTAWRSPVEAATQLTRLSAEFPAFHIALEVTAGYRVRFVARGRTRMSPRMVITPDVAELRAVLGAGDS